MDQRTTKVWISSCGNYMIRWSREVMGVSVKPHYHALVREWAGESKIWNFAGRRGPYRKLNTAMDACEYHLKVWKAAIQIAEGEFKGRADRIRALDGRARVGTAPYRGRVFAGLPLWVRGTAAEAHRIIHGTLYGKPCKTSDDQDDQPEVSVTSESSSPGEPNETETQTTLAGGLALDALVADLEPPAPESRDSRSSKTRAKRARSVKAPATETKKPSKRSTTKKSASGKKKSIPTDETTPSGETSSAKQPVKRKTRSKRSASKSNDANE